MLKCEAVEKAAANIWTAERRQQNSAISILANMHQTDLSKIHQRKVPRSQTACSAPTTPPELPLVSARGAVWINHCPAYHSQPARCRTRWTLVRKDPGTGTRNLNSRSPPNPSPARKESTNDDPERPGTRKPPSLYRTARTRNIETHRGNSQLRRSSPNCLAPSHFDIPQPLVPAPSPQAARKGLTSNPLVQDGIL